MRGDMYVTVLRMPPHSVPDDIRPRLVELPAADRASTLAVAFVDYHGGDLSYREFLVSTTNATLTSGTILKIWVDSAASMAGGRELWAIPKDLADFHFESGERFTGSMFLGGQRTASYSFTPKLTLPGRWRLPNTVMQQEGDAVRKTRSVFRTKLQIGSGKLDIPEDSEVAFLRKGRPIAHSAFRNFTVQFGLGSTLLPTTGRGLTSRP